MCLCVIFSLLFIIFKIELLVAICCCAMCKLYTVPRYAMQRHKYTNKFTPVSMWNFVENSRRSQVYSNLRSAIDCSRIHWNDFVNEKCVRRCAEVNIISNKHLNSIMWNSIDLQFIFFHKIFLNFLLLPSRASSFFSALTTVTPNLGFHTHTSTRRASQSRDI